MIFNNTFFRYIAVGIFNTLIGLSVIWFVKYAFGVSDIPANMMGYGIGILVSFSLNRKWTFRHGAAKTSTFIKFLLVLLVAYLANLSVLIVSINLLGINGYYAQVISIFPYTLIGYLGNKYFTFRRAPSSID